jgi:hypothetical protein
MTPLRNPKKNPKKKKKTLNHAKVPGCTKCPPHPTLIHEVVVHSSSKRRNETRKEDTETGALKNETKKGKRGTKDHKRFCLGRGGEGERQSNSRWLYLKEHGEIEKKEEQKL